MSDSLSLSLHFLLLLYKFMKYGSVPLGIAAQNGHTETVQRLLEAGANPNQQNKVITDCHIIIICITLTQIHLSIIQSSNG